jgi:hypothetical protein
LSLRGEPTFSNVTARPGGIRGLRFGRACPVGDADAARRRFSEQALIEAEGRLGLRLPEDLREFLKVSDAGSLTELVSKLESGSDPFP